MQEKAQISGMHRPVREADSRLTLKPEIWKSTWKCIPVTDLKTKLTKWASKNLHGMTALRHLCSSSVGCIQRMIASCPKLAQNTYNHQHDWVAKFFHHELENIFTSLRNHTLYAINMRPRSSSKMKTTNSTEILPYQQTKLFISISQT
jgi:hypothetical protein